jgi:probable HAF family extracellular repeat protein
VGESETADYSSRAFLYDGTALHDLGSLAPTYSAAYGINASGFIVGWTNVLSTDYSGSEIITEHAFLHDGMAMRDLGTLGGSWSWANGINRLGQVVGASSLVPVNNPTGAPEGQHAFLYDNAGMHDLSTLGGPVSEAYAVNASGQVVGWSYVGQIGNVFHAFLYDGAMHDLSTLGGSFSEAHDVNDRGQVVGLSDTSGDVSYDVFFLTAICAISAIWPKSQRQDGNLLVA